MDPTTDSISIRDMFLWFLGGLAAISSTVATAMIGRIWRQHNAMYEWYKTSVDPEKEKLKAGIEHGRQVSLEKYHKDVADIKHEFSNIKNQVAPILARMANEEQTIIDLMTEINNKLDDKVEKKKR